MIRCATQADSPELCRLFRGVPLPGEISLAYGRDPDFFAPLAVEGEESQVVVAMDREGVSTAAIRSIRQVYVEGRPVRIGYLHGLRSWPGRSRFGRGFVYLHGLHEQDRRVSAYLITVIADNRSTRAMFEKPHASFPHFQPFGDLVTHAIPLRSRSRSIATGRSMGSATASTWSEVADFIGRRHASRQFAPVLDAGAWKRFEALGLGPASFVVSRDGDAITGVLGLWDQSAFKQLAVSAYGPRMRRALPFVNAVLRLTGHHPLPAAGGRVKVVYACFIAVRDDDPGLLSALVDEATARLAGSGAHFLVAGLHERDPLLPAIRRPMSVSYRSSIYLGSWDDGAAFCRTVPRDRIPHLEVCML